MKTFEAIRDVRPHLLRDGITARAIEGERPSSTSTLTRICPSTITRTSSSAS